MKARDFTYTVTTRRVVVVTTYWTVESDTALDVEQIEAAVVENDTPDGVTTRCHDEDDDDRDAQIELVEIIDETTGDDLLR